MDTNTGIEMLYRNLDIRDRTLSFDSTVVNSFNNHCFELDLDRLSESAEISQDFNIPEDYLNLDVEEYIVHSMLDPFNEDCIERNRVITELEMFKARNLYPIIQLLIYIVDTMKENNIVWGVGRGSSVASYCLYLIGVHKINSIKYDIPITEFLK